MALQVHIRQQRFCSRLSSHSQLYVLHSFDNTLKFLETSFNANKNSSINCEYFKIMRRKNLRLILYGI